MNMHMIDSLPFKDRLRYGKSREDQVRKCLNENYKVFNLHPSSKEEDCDEKTDCWQIARSGVAHRCAIKARTTRNDILVAIRDPFYGIDNPRTRMGRDMMCEYLLYITLSKDESVIRVALGKRVHEICNDMWLEWIAAEGDLNPLRYRMPKNLLVSEKHTDCELWLHRDRWTGQPKVLGFIPPKYLMEGREIKYFPFIRG